MYKVLEMISHPLDKKQAQLRATRFKYRKCGKYIAFGFFYIEILCLLLVEELA